jgi:dolichyl-phosphate-mannose--protein O-mannosyl transferase
MNTPAATAPPPSLFQQTLRNPFFLPVLLFLGSWVFFLWGVEYPSKRNFDEFHYVPSAMQFLAQVENQNWEHPPLGKLDFGGRNCHLWGHALGLAVHEHSLWFGHLSGNVHARPPLLSIPGHGPLVRTPHPR